MVKVKKKHSSYMQFNGCTNLKSVDTSNIDFSKITKMAMLDKMSFNRVEWCKERGLIKNLKPQVAEQLNMCAFYAIIPSELIKEFDAL